MKYSDLFDRSLAVPLAIVASASVVACTATGPQSPDRGTAVAEVSYTNDIRPIVSNYCATCHHGDDPDGGFVLDTYEDVRGMVESGELLARIDDEEDPMPPAGMMSRRQRDLFRAWKDGGYLNVGDPTLAPEYEPFEPPLIAPVDVTKHGFDLLERLQGHWVGKMNLMGQDMPWFAWDYRAIAPSHVHAIFEGGTLGNLFTSFFVADLRGTRTIMARNGGLLNGIYRTSYFVLDRVQKTGKSTEYRLVDAYGGEGIMWMSLAFTGERLVFTSHTSRLGLAGPPKRHMRFEGRRMHPELARSAAKAVGFPARDAVYDFDDGLPLPDWGAGVPVTSYSYIWEDKELSVLSLAKLCGDPIRIDQMPHLATLRVAFERSPQLRDMPMEIYLSRAPLTAADGKFLMRQGYPSAAAFDGILMFSRLTAGEAEMTFTYLHPGTYYVTAVGDKNGDGYPSAGDLSHQSVKIEVSPRSAGEVLLPAVDVQN